MHVSLLGLLLLRMSLLYTNRCPIIGQNDCSFVACRVEKVAAFEDVDVHSI